MKKTQLFTPGPTAVPDEVREALARPLVHHRTDTFRTAYREVLDNLRYIMRTENPVVVLSASGTGAMEAAVVNLTRPGEKVLVTVSGKFGDRWRALATAYGLDVVPVEATWGEPVTAEQVERAFSDNKNMSVMFTTHSETSTGVLQDVEAFARIAREHGALIAVDGISSICAHAVLTDAWGLDAVIGGAQKGVMTPPGLSYVSLSRRAIQKMESGRHPCYYFDLVAAVKSAEKGETPYTPAVPLVFAMRRALEMIRNEGIENVIARHAANAAAVRAAVRAMNLALLATVPCNATTAVVPPEGTADPIRVRMEEIYGVKIAGGQASLKGKIVRLGHLGYYGATDMYTMVSAFEATLKDLGVVASFGAGIDALRKSFAGGSS